MSHQFSQMDNKEGGVFYLTVRNARISSYRVGILFTKVDVLKSFQVKRLSDVKKNVKVFICFVLGLFLFFSVVSVYHVFFFVVFNYFSSVLKKNTTVSWESNSVDQLRKEES